MPTAPGRPSEPGDDLRRRRARPASASPPCRGPCAAPHPWPTRPASASSPPSPSWASAPATPGTSLAERRHAANGIVFPDLSGPYYAEVLLGYEETASRLGRSVLVLATHGRPDPAQAVRDLAGRVDGLVLLGRTVDDDVVAELTSFGLPVVAGRPSGRRRRRRDPRDQRRRRPRARAPPRRARRPPGRVPRLPGPLPDVAERWEGVRDALGEHGVDAAGDPVPDLDEDSGTRLRRPLLAARRPARRPRLRQRRDRARRGRRRGAGRPAGRAATSRSPAGTTSWLPATPAPPSPPCVSRCATLGALAAEVLDERITGTRTTPRHESLPTDLVVRDSCGTHQ